MKKIILPLILVGVVAGGAAFYTKFLGAATPTTYRTAPVKRGDLSITISATGTLEPEEVVDVGAQVMGPILNFGMDPRATTDTAFKDKRIDYGSPVEEGTVLAQIDPAVYKANLNQAQASLLRAKSDVDQLIARRNQLEAEWKRAQKLRSITVSNLSPTGDKLNSLSQPIKAISDSDYDLARANYEVAKSNVEVGEATVAQAQAALSLAETNIGYTTIKSPVKGTIIDRRVNVGQTVVSSLNAPSLFLIAKDLRQIQVWASVNEADIGRLKLGMPASFTVDAFPNDVFHGRIAQIRLNATMTQNVVTYTVVVATENPDMKLLPYLTAEVKFEVDGRKDALLVPNAALRWQPKPEQIAANVRETLESSSQKSRGKAGATAEASADNPESSANPSAERTTDTGRADKSGRERAPRATVWVKDGDFVRPVEVRVGPSDNVLTEVRGADLSEGLEVVLGEIKDTGSVEVSTNPFAPQFFRGGRQGQRSGQGQDQGQGGKGPGGQRQGGQGRGQGPGQKAP